MTSSLALSIRLGIGISLAMVLPMMMVGYPGSHLILMPGNPRSKDTSTAGGTPVCPKVAVPAELSAGEIEVELAYGRLARLWKMKSLRHDHAMQLSWYDFDMGSSLDMSWVTIELEDTDRTWQ
jgi:hypothetical protein